MAGAPYPAFGAGPRSDRGLGEGEVYELVQAPYRVVSDPKVLQWRQKELERLGFGHGMVMALRSNADADLHQLERMIEAGCSHQTAWEIIGMDLPVSGEAS